MEEIVKALVAATQEQPHEKQEEYLFTFLMELSTAFEGTLFDDAVHRMQKYWGDQATQ